MCKNMGIVKVNAETELPALITFVLFAGLQYARTIIVINRKTIYFS
jgi:hypothetical protein